MSKQNSILPELISHNIEVGKDSTGKQLFRNWGNSKLEFSGIGAPTSYCEFCKSDFGIDDVYKTTCSVGTYASDDFLLKHHISGFYNPEYNSLQFYCCKDCMPKITSLIQIQRKELLNHEILNKVLTIMVFIFK